MEAGFDMISMEGMDRNGNFGKIGGRPGHDSFPIVYKRRFLNLDLLSSSMPPQPSSIVQNECNSVGFAVVQRNGASSRGMGKQLTLEQFWGGRTCSKLVDRLPLLSGPADEVPGPLQVENVDFTRQVAEMKSVIKRKRVEKPGLTVDLNDKPGSDYVHIPGVAKVGRGKGWRKGLGKKQLAKKQLGQNSEKRVGQNAEGADQNSVRGVGLPAGGVPAKKRRLGRPPMEGMKRGRGRVRSRPGKRPKLVLARNRKLEVEYLIGPRHEPQLVEFLQGNGLEGREYPAARPHLPFLEKSLPLGRGNEDGSSSRTQTEDDFPARVGSGQKTQHRDVSSEATQSETATETDLDLPLSNRQGRSKHDNSDEEGTSSDCEQIPIDLNVLPELLMSAKSRKKKRAQRMRTETEKLRKPAINRPEIHQQIKPLDQEKAVAANQVAKSLWSPQCGPQVRHGSHESLRNVNSIDPISSNSGKYVMVHHVRSPPILSRKAGFQLELQEQARVVDGFPKVDKSKVVQLKVPRVSLAPSMSKTRLGKLDNLLPVHSQVNSSAGTNQRKIILFSSSEETEADIPPPVHSVLNGVAGAKQIETIHSSSSEETESDREHPIDRSKPAVRFQGMVLQGQSPGGLTNETAAVVKASPLLHPRRHGEHRSIGSNVMSGKPYTKLPVKRTVIDAGPVHRMAQGVSRKSSLVANLSDDSETQSDNEKGSLRVSASKPPPLLPNAAQVGMNQQSSERSKCSGLLKVKFIKNSENVTYGKCHVQSSPALVKSIGSAAVSSPVNTVGSFSVSTEKHPGGPLSRKIVQRAKIIRSPQVRPIASGFQIDRALTRFSPYPSQKKRKLNEDDGSILQGFEINDRRHSDGRKGSDTVSEAHCLNLYSSLEKNPNNIESHLDILYGSPEAEPSVKLRSKKARMVNGVAVRVPVRAYEMTPRTRKLTDAMQKFVTQKANRRQWREVDLNNIHPIALIGRTCKVYWPLDEEWYPGVIHDYNPQTKKHRVDYKDNEMEMVLVSKERFKLKLSPEEWVELETSTGEQLLSKLNPIEQAESESPVDEEEKLGHGDLVWAKVKGYPMWPAFVLDEDHANACGMDPGKKGMIPIQFFGSYDYCRLNSKKLLLFSKGLAHKFHTKCKRVIFVQGLEEVERYLKECKLPDSMAGLLDDEDGLLGASERRWQEIEENWPKLDEQETRGEDRRMIRRRAKRIVTFPLQLGALTIVSLGKVVRDSEHFHDQQYIWPEGYASIRRFPSAKDPDAIVEYKLQVFRNPLSQSHPLFRVTPVDDTPVEGPSPYACWKKAFQRLRKAHEKVGKIPELDKRMQYRSAAHMFGFSNSRVSKMIQSLPNARACTKFINWSVSAPTDEDVEAVLPAGYHPVDISWKHLDRCTVCYVDEEYVDNLLLQCDKCRIMVHMNCYGELELPDGDLWLCNLCRPEAPKTRPPCCLCPVTSGAMKKTTDGRWGHIMCAMWIPETCLIDVKRMEPVDGVNAVAKERWRLTCSICKVPYGACIQCSVNSCRTAFHPLCARSAGLYMEVLEEKQKVDGESDLRLLAYCRKHKQPTNRTCEAVQPTSRAKTDCLAYEPPVNASGCARSEPYHAAARRGRREPEALAAALAKRLFVENLPYRVTGCRQNPPRKIVGCSNGSSMWSLHWEGASKGSSDSSGPFALTPTKSGEDVEILSMSDKFRRMKSSLSQRLVFGKSAIHGMGVFTKQVHCANDMIIEYAGEVVRPVIADIRERRCYDSLVGAGTYMFRIDDERVVDATHAGSIAHLINHSCEPNCYSRTVTASGEDRIIIFAKRNIEIGEELTYDYRFMSKDEVLTCYCGCAGCRGSVNVVDSDGDFNKSSVPLSNLIKLPATTRGHTH
ncbi:hypothetical protein KC19_VG186600 [Ceratodon purpureus]|uniref:Uncharacterized protein n=1 Tax=Ceratodon purpureus TaxID=3225 RepID=A0A8T0HRC4_CERPU|nr:hypothetical protein KC19_VG186600 [Ceratodon purpureus]